MSNHMPLKRYVYTGSKFSNGAKALANEMQAKRIKPKNSKFKPSARKAVVNWGSSSMQGSWLVNLGAILNPPDKLADVINKLEFLRMCDAANVRIPSFTSERAEALEWVKEGRKILARTLLTSHSGNGIIVCEGEEAEVPNAPLYVEYVKKKDEYRVHFIQGTDEPFVQRKARVNGVDNPNWDIRNLGGGFIYANDPSNVGKVPSDVINQARLAFECCGLHFGAVDVLWNEHYGKAYVLEINTAPGLVGRTVDYYASGLKALINAL